MQIKKLQELIKEMKDDLSSANVINEMCARASIEQSLEIKAIAKALEKYIPKLEKILNEATG